MDYGEFVVQFRARAAARMVEFEKALAKAQKEAAAAKAHTVPVKETPTPQSPVQIPDHHKTQAAPTSLMPVQPARGRTRGRGPVQSILRKS